MSITCSWQVDQTALAVFSYNNRWNVASKRLHFSFYGLALHSTLLLVHRVARHTCNSYWCRVVCVRTAWRCMRLIEDQTVVNFSVEIIIGKFLYSRGGFLCRRKISPRSVWVRDLSSGLLVGSSNFVRWITGAQVWRHTCTRLCGCRSRLWIQVYMQRHSSTHICPPIFKP